jgi:hypothetical protein
MHTCERCHRDFKKKCDYDRHIARKFPCTVIYQEELFKTPTYWMKKATEYEKEVKRLSSLVEEKNAMIEEKNAMLEEKNAIIEEKNKEIQAILSSNNTKAQSNNITINADNVMINMAAFGSETCSRLYRQEKVNVLKSGDSCVISMIKHIHDNDRLPEFRNICVTNMRASGGYVYEHNRWKFNSYDDMLYMLMNARMSDLEDLIRDEDVSKEIMNINRIKEIVNDYWGDSDKFLKAHKQKIITALYNYTKDNMNRYSRLIKSTGLPDA